MLHIDGTMGEGGGQVLRSALSLSLVTGTPFRVSRIRAGRARPGLLRQHLTSVRAAAAIGDAEVTGAHMGSQEIAFTPRGIVPGTHRFSIGSAGSVTLVLQTVFPALVTASAPSTIIVEGGTHNPAAPPFEFLARAYLPVIARMGPRAVATLERAGFHPKGGGCVKLEVIPAARLAPIELLDRGDMRRRRASAVIAKLPRHIARREIDVLARRLGFGPSELSIETIDDGAGPGNVVMAEIESEHVTEVFTGFGERTIRAEDVAGAVADEVQAYLEAGVAVGEHFSDQLLLAMALAGGGAFTTLPLSSHARTQAEVIALFLGVRIRTTELGANAVRVEVGS